MFIAHGYTLTIMRSNSRSPEGQGQCWIYS